MAAMGGAWVRAAVLQTCWAGSKWAWLVVGVVAATIGCVKPSVSSGRGFYTGRDLDGRALCWAWPGRLRATPKPDHGGGVAAGRGLCGAWSVPVGPRGPSRSALGATGKRRPGAQSARPHWRSHGPRDPASWGLVPSPEMAVPWQGLEGVAAPRGPSCAGILVRGVRGECCPEFEGEETATLFLFVTNSSSRDCKMAGPSSTAHPPPELCVPTLPPPRENTRAHTISETFACFCFCGCCFGFCKLM